MPIRDLVGPAFATQIAGKVETDENFISVVVFGGDILSGDFQRTTV